MSDPERAYALTCFSTENAMSFFQTYISIFRPNIFKESSVYSSVFFFTIKGFLTAYILTVRTVNLNKLACVVIGEAQLLSRYRRIQRFFAGFTLNYTQIAGFVFQRFFISGGQWYLSMDRTNWR